MHTLHTHNFLIKQINNYSYSFLIRFSFISCRGHGEKAFLRRATKLGSRLLSMKFRKAEHYVVLWQTEPVWACYRHC